MPGFNGATAVALEGGPTGVLSVAAIVNNTLRFTRSVDGGVTFEAPRDLLGTASDAEISMDAMDDEVYIAVSTGDVQLLRNSRAGAGDFSGTSLAMTNVFHEVILDKINGDVFVCSDDPSLHVRRSVDGGATFAAETRPAGTDFFSDWAGGNGFLYVVGTGGDSDDIEVIPMNDAGTSTEVLGLPTVNSSNTRAIDADALGNAYVVTQLDTGVIQLDRLVFGAPTIDAADVRAFGNGTFPGVAALPSNSGALVVFTQGTQVFAAVEVY